MQKTILITGGAGFIGSNLSTHLIKEGHKVICVDSFFSGKKENIAHLLKSKNFKLIKHNIIYPIRQNFDVIDEIYHLACPASPVQYQFDPVLTLRSGVDGTRNMLDLARKYDARLVFTSSSEVYGDPLEHPQKETYFGNVDPLGKRSCYDEGKRAAESLCKDYHEQYGVDVRIVRLFNIYGPRMMFNDGRVISNFILQAILNEDMTIHGNGHQSRSFMYIDDLIEGITKVMALPHEETGMRPFNLGNPDERTIEELAKELKVLADSRSNIVYVDYDKIPGRWGDPQKRQPDITRAKKVLFWEPKIGFREGLERTIADFRSRLNKRTRIAVFAPSYYPLEGPAEEAVKEMSERLMGYDFDLFVAKLKSDLPSEEKIGRVNVYRIGSGSKFDKYLLPLRVPFMVARMHKQKDYQAAWGIMASYGSLAAAVFSWLTKRALMVSLYEGKLDETRSVKGRLLKPFYKVILRKAHYLQVVGELTQSQLAWLEDDRHIEGVDLEKGWDYVSKKTKEKLQELEILSSRL
jgi:UDP-glucuronate decarboxylase